MKRALSAKLKGMPQTRQEERAIQESRFLKVQRNFFTRGSNQRDVRQEDELQKSLGKDLKNRSMARGSRNERSKTHPNGCAESFHILIQQPFHILHTE